MYICHGISSEFLLFLTEYSSEFLLYEKRDIRETAWVAKSIFEPDHDIPRIIRTLSAHTGVDIVPKDTLIVIDEIQESAAALGCKLFFYSNPSRENKDDRMEIDFLISKKTITSRHNISPIEVKSSTGFTTTSLEKCIKKYSAHLAQAYIVHTGDVKKDGDYLYIPLYMFPCL